MHDNDVFRSAPYPRWPTPLIDSVKSVTRPDLSAVDTATFVAFRTGDYIQDEAGE